MDSNNLADPKENLEISIDDISVCNYDKRVKLSRYFVFLLMFLLELFVTCIFGLFISYNYNFEYLHEIFTKYLIYITIIYMYFLAKNRRNELNISTLIRFIFCCVLNLIILFCDSYLSNIQRSADYINTSEIFNGRHSYGILYFMSFILLFIFYFYSKGIEKIMNTSKSSTLKFCIIYTLATLGLLIENIVRFTYSRTVLNVTRHFIILLVLIFQLVYIVFSLIKKRKIGTVIVPLALIYLYFWNIFSQIFSIHVLKNLLNV
ncbi:hypothetical protein CWI38_0328p0030 [Hamiltosporidium tvaerminnensis]|uniref:Uncharacterized protein n=1 Tax=Hamiltosporidium tvaerminnensis TaxID=1176355 RepID=A0A4V2JY08_9MICR|nr:hypothetical protein CWI38_0328p0030 [Hamiltosporidium tvaerminnensis]